ASSALYSTVHGIGIKSWIIVLPQLRGARGSQFRDWHGGPLSISIGKVGQLHLGETRLLRKLDRTAHGFETQGLLAIAGPSVDGLQKQSGRRMAQKGLHKIPILISTLGRRSSLPSSYQTVVLRPSGPLRIRHSFIHPMRRKEI